MKDFLKIILIIIITFNSCINTESKNTEANQANNKISNTISENPIEEETKQVAVVSTDDDSLYLNGTLGLLVCKNVYDTINILNQDKSTFVSFSFKGDESKAFYSKLDSILNNFKTFAYHPDYALLIFLCTKFKFFYEIYLENDIVKYIDLNSELFKFYTWQEFVLSNEYSSIVDDNFSFYEEPNYSSNEITFIRKQDEIFFITGIQVINDWLKVKVEYPNTEETTFGWIKWRNQENILIDFYFLL